MNTKHDTNFRNSKRRKKQTSSNIRDRRQQRLNMGVRPKHVSITKWSKPYLPIVIKFSLKMCECVSNIENIRN